MLEPGEIFGAARWEESNAHRNVTAEVLTEATVGVVTAKNFQFFLKRKPHLAMPPRKTFGSLVKRYLNWRSAESGNVNLVTSCRKSRPRMTNPLLNIAFRSPASRLALLLQNYADAPRQGREKVAHGSQCTLHKLSTRKLARFIGSSVENMEALLNQFKQHGIIEKRYRRIQILDPWHLKKIANARMKTLPPKTIESQENTQTYEQDDPCLLYTSPSPRDRTRSRMPSSA